MAPFIGGLDEKSGSKEKKVLKAEDKPDQQAMQSFTVPPERYIRTPSDELLEEAKGKALQRAPLPALCTHCVHSEHCLRCFKH